jgi:hypothetical protein
MVAPSDRSALVVIGEGRPGVHAPTEGREIEDDEQDDEPHEGDDRTFHRTAS